jgi:hypothetical protein
MGIRSKSLFMEIKSYIIILVILIFFGAIVAYFFSEDGEKTLKDMEAFFYKFFPQQDPEHGLSGTSLVRQLFYGYNHTSVKNWKAWIKAQDRDTQSKACQILREHLEGEPKFWGNISSEVLDGVLIFDELNPADYLVSFLEKTSKIFGDYMVISELYEKGFYLLYELDPNKAINCMWSEFSDEKIEKDKNFGTKANLIITMLPNNEEYTCDFASDILVRERLDISIRQNIFRKVLGFNANFKNLVIKNILTKYSTDPSKIEQKSYEKNSDYEARVEMLKILVDHAISSINKAEIYKLLCDLCKHQNELQRIIHNKTLSIINNSNEIDASKAISIYYLPDTIDNKIKLSLANKNKLSQIELREIVLKPRIVSQDLDETIGKKDSIYPVPATQENIFKDFSKIFGTSAETVLNEINNNSMLLTGDDQLRKAYMCYSLAKKSNIPLRLFDLKTQLSDNGIFSLRKQIESINNGIIFLDSLEAVMNIENLDLKSNFAIFIQSLKETINMKEYRLVFSVNLPNAEIDNSQKFKKFIDDNIIKFCSDSMEINSTKNYVHEVTTHYSRYLSNGAEEYPSFIEEFNSSNNFKHSLEYEFNFLEELSAQLLIYGAPKSYLDLDEKRKALFTGSIS